MHWLDIIILVVLGVGAAMGFYSGLLWQVARVVSLALSIYLAIVTNTPIASWLGEQYPDLNVAASRIGAFIVVFLLVYLALYLLTRAIHNAIKAANLETMDRVLGALLGALKMAAVAACICGLMAALDLQLFKEWFEQAVIARHFAKGTDAVVGLIPQTSRDRLDEGVQQVRDQLQQKMVDAAADALKGDALKGDAAKK
jgi:membrane protein required for colicin V production